MPIKLTNDGTGRKPRDTQVAVFEWLEENWDVAPIKVMTLPTGAGKSFIARAVQLATDASIITPSNMLIDQYRADYPDVNFLKGQDHYECKSWGMTCREYSEMRNADSNMPRCEECPYSSCRRVATSGAPTFFNPMTLYHLKDIRATTIVVDEAHQLASMLLMLTGKRYQDRVYGDLPDKLDSQFDVLTWLGNVQLTLKKLTTQYRLILGNPATTKMARMEASKKVGVCEEELDSIGLVMLGLRENPQNYANWIEHKMVKGVSEKYLNIKPLRVPRFMLQRFFKDRNVVLMSGTLFKHDVEDLVAGLPYVSYEGPSPIPVERRIISHMPVPFRVNSATDPARIAQALLTVMEAHPGNTLIHAPYSLVKKLTSHMPQGTLTIAEGGKTKDKTLAKFLKKGGILLAGGCAEGLDLKDDLCRVNIIPKLLYPDLMDTVVKKRKDSEGGDLWYALETLKTTVQQAGRSTRNENDFSITIVLDPNFDWMVRKYKAHLPKYFLEAIKWGPHLKLSNSK